VAHTAYAVFVVIKYAGAAYLLYLAYRLWTASAKSLTETEVEKRERPLQLFLGSLSLTLGNPKTMVFFLAVLPTVVELKTLTVAGFLEIALVISLVLPAILLAYTYFAARTPRHFSRPQSVRWLQRGTAPSWRVLP
jgi:threonine/homoserine/homoserine lactone efflux protein